jgi:hypothetical protein
LPANAKCTVFGTDHTTGGLQALEGTVQRRDRILIGQRQDDRR